MKRILIVDRDRIAAQHLAELLRLSEPALCSVIANTPRGAALLADELEVDLALIDVTSDAQGGASTARAIAGACGHRAPVMVGVASDQGGVEVATDMHLFDQVLCKPVRVAGLLRLIDLARTA